MDKFKIVRDNPALHELIIEKWTVSYGSDTAIILRTHRGKWVVCHKSTPYMVNSFLSAQIRAMELFDVRIENRVEARRREAVESDC